MGRTLPTFRQLIDEAAQRWGKFRRALRREDQEHFDHLFQRVRQYTQAATYQCNDNPMEAILLAIALDLEKRLRRLEKLAPGVEENHETEWMDFRPLSRAAGDEAVADDAGTDDAQTD